MLPSKHKGYACHSELYDSVFAPYRDKEIRLLEIGVNRGGSLRVWKEYFQKGMIFGVDINPKCLRFTQERVQVDLVDQSSEQSWLEYKAQLDAGFDIIIDDGSHIPEHQILTFEEMWPSVRPGGLYVVEDTDPEFVEKPGKCIKYFQDIAATISRETRYRPGVLKPMSSILFKYNLILMEKI